MIGATRPRLGRVQGSFRVDPDGGYAVRPGRLSTMSNALPPSGGPPGPAGSSGRGGLDEVFARLRASGFVRADQGRWAGGVCAGIADRLGISALLVRIVLLVLMSAGGVGLLAYLVALALMPDRRGKILAEGAVRGDGDGIVLLVVVGILLAAEISDRWWVWLGIPLAIGTWWLVKGAASGKSPQQLRDEARGLAGGWRPRSGSTPPGTPAAMTTQPAPGAGPQPNTLVQQEFPALTGPQPASLAPAPTRQTTAPIPQDRPVGPHGLGPGRTYVPSGVATAPVLRHVRRRRGGMPVFVTALGLGLTAYGLVVQTHPTLTGNAKPTSLALLAAGAAAALVLLITALTGRRAGFTAFLTVLVVASGALSATLPASATFVAGVGEQTWRPMSGTSAAVYSMAAGQANLDLTAAGTGTGAERPVTVSLGVGELDATVAPGQTVELQIDLGLGDSVRQDTADGAGKESLGEGPGLRQTVRVGTGATPDVVVKVSVGMGSIVLIAPAGTSWTTTTDTTKHPAAPTSPGGAR